MLLPDTNLAEATLAADRLRKRVEGLRVPIDGESLSLSISLGAAEVLPADSDESVVARADEALYGAKNAGRNRVCYHDGTQAATMPLGGEQAWPPIARDRGELIAEGMQEHPHPGFSTMLSDLVCRVAECERTGSPLSVLLIEIDQDAASGSGAEMGVQERIAIGECLRATLREMDKTALMGSRRYGSILPGASEEMASAVAQRASENVVAMKSRGAGFSGLALRTSTATYRLGDDAVSLLARAESGLISRNEVGGAIAVNP